MKLGSHNTMTYLRPKKWYMYPFKFIAQCQSKNYKKQYEKGARIFDLRLKTSVNIDDEPIVAHGLMDFKTHKGFVDEFLTYLNEQCDETIYVRLIYEMQSVDKTSQAKEKEDNFIKLCQTYVDKYKNILFIGGNRKYDWKKLIKLEKDPEYIDLYSSMTWKKWDDWCPYLYALIMNKKNKEIYKEFDGYLLIDFI